MNDNGGMELHLKRGQDMKVLFGDRAGTTCFPSRKGGQSFPSGAFEQLWISYEILGDKGILAVNEKDRRLWSSVMVGTPSTPYMFAWDRDKKSEKHTEDNDEKGSI